MRTQSEGIMANIPDKYDRAYTGAWNYPVNNIHKEKIYEKYH